MHARSVSLRGICHLCVLELALLLAACSGGGSGGGSSGTPSDSVSGEVGAAGGTLTTPSGSVQLVVPASALATSVAITIAPSTANTPSGNIGGVFDLGPSGTIFSPPATLRVRYDPALIPIEVDETSLTLAFASGSTWTDVPTAVDTVGRTLIGQVAHFSAVSVKPVDRTSPDFTWSRVSNLSNCLTSNDANYNNKLADLALRIFNLKPSESPPVTGVGCITLPYLADGYTRELVTLQSEFRWQNHAGIDFRNRNNDNVARYAYAVHDGIVRAETLDEAAGKSTLLIESTVNGRLLWIYYLHCQSHDQIRDAGGSPINLGRLSDTDPAHRNVVAGDAVCLTGALGASGGAHLHLEVKSPEMNGRSLAALSGSSCPASTFLDFLGNLVKGCALAYIQANTLDPINILPVEIAPTIIAVNCTAPIVGQVMTCTVTGTNLPASGMTLTATNCSPASMAQQVGGSGTSRTFTCTPVALGTVSITGLSVPGFTGTLPVLPSYAANPPIDKWDSITWEQDKWG
jgi:hypothetical protein